MKKIASLLMVALLAGSTLTACGGSGGGGNVNGGVNQPQLQVATLWSAENTVSYMRDSEIPEGAKLDLSMEAIKGETESVQLMITAKEEVTAFNVSVGDLVSATGEKIEKSNVEVFAEKYIETKAPSVDRPFTADMF
ncbi:MAG: hypothetical protein E7352_07335 [Clostridiales bacterium]|nr:hypothetical protein [Clostridiales bacterium]MBE5747967.1 hypothetical protein [Clostridiales bacterium]